MHPPYPPNSTNLERNYTDTEVQVTHDYIGGDLFKKESFFSLVIALTIHARQGTFLMRIGASRTLA